MSGLESGAGETRPKVVVVFGVFDLLHPGHLMFLKAARQRGDRLIVVATRDERVQAEKGRAPYYRLEERMSMLSALECVDEVVPGDPAGAWTMVEQLAPDVICLGHDQNVDHPKIMAQIGRLVTRPQIIQLDAFERKRYSTSAICRALDI
ncbi:MAG: adenylyltransferase/cytidyltransferase family protein [Patescibacteria group bacterium]|nr:adenylyltransferase/cytidyltransferase family protein [Patescibacteria group bacterium]